MIAIFEKSRYNLIFEIVILSLKSYLLFIILTNLYLIIDIYEI